MHDEIRTGDWVYFPLSGHPQLLQITLATPRRVWFKQFQRTLVREGSTTPRVFAELLRCQHDLVRGDDQQ